MEDQSKKKKKKHLRGKKRKKCYVEVEKKQESSLKLKLDPKDIKLVRFTNGKKLGRKRKRRKNIANAISYCFVLYRVQ